MAENKNYTDGFPYVSKPLTKEEIEEIADHGWITVGVPIDLEEIINLDNFHGFLDLINEKIGCIITEQTYSIAGLIDENTMILKVQGLVYFLGEEDGK